MLNLGIGRVQKMTSENIFNRENEEASVGAISFIPGYEKIDDIEKRIDEFIQKNIKTKEVKNEI